MKFLLHTLLGIFLLSTALPLFAGEIIIYGGAQKPGELKLTDASLSEFVGDLKGDFGSTFGIRFSAGRIIGFEQNIGYSPRFAKPGVKAFQTDSNILLQTPGKVAIYATAGLGFVRSWGQDDFPVSGDSEEIVEFAFSSVSNYSLNYGGGLKIRRLWGPLGINLDVRGYRLPDFKVKFDDQTITDKGLSFIQTTAGLAFTW
jgi:hypothetical protein